MKTSEHTLVLTLQQRVTEEDGKPPIYTVVTHLLADGEQIPMCSSVEVRAASDEVLPEVIVRFLEGWQGQMSPELAAKVAAVTQTLRKFSFVSVEAPDQ